MSYEPNTRKITAPVSIYDVQQALGVGSPDLYTLYRSVKVNKWSKYKPLFIRNHPDNREQGGSDYKMYLTFSQMTEGGSPTEVPSPTLHELREPYDNQIGYEWWWGNLWGYRVTSSSVDEFLWRKSVLVAGYTLKMLNIAGLWVPTFFDNSLVTTGSQYNYSAETIAKIKVILEALEQDYSGVSINWKSVSWGDVTSASGYDPSNYVSRLTDFENYDMNAGMPVNYRFPIALVSGESVEFGISEVANALPLHVLLKMTSDLEEIVYTRNYSAVDVFLNVIAVNNGTAQILGFCSIYSDPRNYENFIKERNGEINAKVTVAVNDLGSVGDSVKLYMIATVMSMSSSVSGYFPVRTVFLPIATNINPHSLMIRSNNPDALEMFQLLYEAGGSQKIIELYMPIEEGDEHERQDIDGTVSIYLLNTEATEKEVDLEAMRIRWTWAGIYSDTVGSMGMIATDIWVNSEDDVKWADNPTGLGEQLTYDYNSLYASGETHAAKRVLWSYTNSQHDWSNSFDSVSYNETPSNQIRRLAKIKIPANGSVVVSYKLNMMDAEIKYGVSVENLHSIFDNQYIDDTGEARHQQTGVYEILPEDLQGNHGGTYYNNMMELCLENTSDNNPTKRIVLDTFYAASLPYHYKDYS